MTMMKMKTMTITLATEGMQEEMAESEQIDLEIDKNLHIQIVTDGE